MPFVNDDVDVDVDVDDDVNIDSSAKVLAIKSKSMIDRRRDVTISSSSMVGGLFLLLG